LDPQQCLPLCIVEVHGLPDPERFAVDLEHAPNFIVFDPIVVTDRDQPLTHLLVDRVVAPPLVAVLTAFLSPLLPSFAKSHQSAPSTLRPLASSSRQCRRAQAGASPETDDDAVLHPRDPRGGESKSA
jgi:hypothetical protein